MLEALLVERTAEHECCDDAVPIALTPRATGTLDRRGAPCFRATRIMTMKRRNLTTVLPVLCIACGARSDLYLQAPPRDASIAEDAAPDGAAPDAPIPEDASVIPTGCTSALEPGSPAPITGYCSTQAHVAPTRVPSSPKATWAIQLDADTSPSEMVIDRDGRIYVASCRAEEGWVTCKQIVSLLPDGAIAWSKTFDGHVRGLYLDTVGTLHAEFGNPRTLVAVDPAGAVTQLGQLPENVWYEWVGSDGSLYGSSIDYGGTQPDRLVKMTPTGDVLWSTLLPCSKCIATTALSPDDEMESSRRRTAGSRAASFGWTPRATCSGRLSFPVSQPNPSLSHPMDPCESRSG